MSWSAILAGRAHGSSVALAGAPFLLRLAGVASLAEVASSPRALTHHQHRQPHHLRHSSYLAYEEITAGAPTSAHPTASPRRTLLVLHGLLGCGRNWRTWARRLVEGAAASQPAEGGPWRALLVDLRCHGNSARRTGMHPPHNMHTAAADVSRLIRHIMGSHPPGAVLGHSMGGKVALALLEQSAAAAAAGPGAGAGHPAGQSGVLWCAPPRQLWVLDSQPGLVAAEQDLDTGVSKVLSTVHSIPLPIPSRAWLLQSLRERGLTEALATWLASNLTPWPQAGEGAVGGVAAAAAAGAQHHSHAHAHAHPHQPHPAHHIHTHHGRQEPHSDQPSTHPYQQQQKQHQPGQGHGPQLPAPRAGGGPPGGPLTWSFDIQGAAAMYMSYRTTNFWPVLERPPPGTRVYLVQGERSDRWPPEMRQRLRRVLELHASGGGTGAGGAGGSGAVAPGFQHHVLERAGHWLHVDNPEGLLRLVLPRLAGL